MDMDNQQKWMASISKALEELKRGTEFMQSEGPSKTPSATGSAQDSEEERGEG
jgi:hypothetical protein